MVLVHNGLNYPCRQCRGSAHMDHHLSHHQFVREGIRKVSPGYSVLAGIFLPLAMLCNVEKTRPEMFSHWILFPSVCCYEMQHFGSEIWRCGSQGYICFLFPSGIYVSGIPMAAAQAEDLQQYMKDLQGHHQILSENAQTGSQIRWEASRQTDILHTVTCRPKGENPARSLMDHRRKPQR